MPINFTPDQAARALPGLELTPPAPDPTSAAEQIGAALSLENVFVSGLNRISEGPTPEVTKDFDVEDFVTEGEKLILSEFAGVGSFEELQLVRKRIENERELRRLLGSGPLPEFLATTLAILADPTTFIPFGGAFLKGGKFITKLAAGAAVGVASVGVAEGALQATQQTRSLEQSIAAIMMGGAFGLGLAGLGAKLGARAAKTGKAYAAAVTD